jgi:hypothetical protein
MRMTGKEALEKLLDTLKHWQGRNTIFDKIHSKHILDELELLEKYKRAFEILKDSELIHFFKYEETDIYEIITGDGTQILTKEEYELLEELMKGE